jgi:hypothetical protein
MAQWQSQSVASRRWSVLSSALGGERGREEVVPVPHVSNSQPTVCQSGGDAACIRFPYLGSLTGGPQSGFQTWREPEPVWAALFVSLAR